MRILIIEDELRLLRSLTRVLQENGYAVDSSSDGAEGLFKAQSIDYNAVVLDGMLPTLDGWDVLAALRKHKRTPVLMLTARDRIEDRVKGLDFGADDYLVKPFDTSELLARLRALIRRSFGETQPIIEVGNMVIDLNLRKVTKAGQSVTLTAREFSILEYLALRRGAVVSRTTLYERLFDEMDDSLSNVIDVHVFSIRRKLSGSIITTHRGHGYSFTE